MTPEERWQTAAATKFRTPNEPEQAPYGFATRVVAAAQLGLPKQSRALLLWRRYSLSMAAATAVVLAINLSHQPAQAQFLPLPELDLPNSHPTQP